MENFFRNQAVVNRNEPEAPDDQGPFICGYCQIEEIAFDEDGCDRCLKAIRKQDDIDNERSRTMNDLTVQENKTAQEIRAQVNLIQDVMKSVMKEDTHYGTIPGCKKPSLYKPGSEIILSTFKLACEPIVEDLSTSDESRFRVTTKLTHMKTSAFVGAGIGECSSNESKYKWRKPVCKEEFDETPEDKKREKWQAGFRGQPNKKVRQIRTEIADVANTILKMAKKRAQIDATLTATAASDIFTQDVEDMPSEILGNSKTEPTQKPAVEMPKMKPSPTAASVTDLSRKCFKTKPEYSNWLKERFGVSAQKDLSNYQITEANTALTKMLSDKNNQKQEA